MHTNIEDRDSNQRGIAMVTTLMLTLLLSILVGAMLISSTADVLISGNDMRSNQAYYVAEAGVNRAASWFAAKFGTDVGSTRYLLPEQYDSNTQGATGKLSYTATPVFKKGAVITTSTPEQNTPTAVKTLVNGQLQNVVLSGDSTNTYPKNYTVTANNAAGTNVTRTYAGEIVSDFAASLYNQAFGQSSSDGKFSVKATLVSIIPPGPGEPNGNITWLIESTGRIIRGNDTAIASATMTAYVTAPLVPITRTEVVNVNTQQVGATPGVISRNMIRFTGGARVDSYKSSKGAYGAALSANSYEGQIGARNLGSRGDLRTNNELLGTDIGFIDIQNGTVTGRGYSTLPSPVDGGPEGLDAIAIDTSGKVNNGRGGPFSASDKYYRQSPLVFPPVANPTPPAAGAVNYSYNKRTPGTLPSGNYNNISISGSGELTVPPGNYGTLSASGNGVVYLGVPGQMTTYNFQGVTTSGGTKIVFRGPVTINVAKNLTVSGGSGVSDPSLPASAIRWNFKGGNNEKVTITGNADTLGVFYAPNNDLTITGTGDFYGAIIARNVTVTGSGAIHIDQDAVTGVMTTQSSQTTTTSVVGYTASNYRLRRIMQTVN